MWGHEELAACPHSHTPLNDTFLTTLSHCPIHLLLQPSLTQVCIQICQISAVITNNSPKLGETIIFTVRNICFYKYVLE